MMGREALQLFRKARGADDGGGAQPHHQLLADVHGAQGFPGPALQLVAARGQDTVFPLAAAPAFLRQPLDPACRLKARQLPIDLLMRRLPEIAD
jgi:hypothetical protein